MHRLRWFLSSRIPMEATSRNCSYMWPCLTNQKRPDACYASSLEQPDMQPSAAFRAALSAAFIGVGAPTLFAQVDFQRDVQPIFREHCVSCHGPDRQMSGLRLDRRADAMRGGSQSDIGPGSADGSRLYHRLIDTVFGPRMPPAGPLSAEQIDTIKTWIDEGAEWPDAVAGDVAAPPADPDATRLIASFREGDQSRIDAVMADAAGAAALRGARGATPLMAAALYGDAARMKRLLRAGADPNATNVAGATALMWAVPDV